MGLKRCIELGLKRCIGSEALKKYEELVSQKAEREFTATKETQRRKLDTLIDKSRSATKWNENAACVSDAAKDRWVVNLSDRVFLEVEMDVLRKGTNFSPVPQRLPVMDIITSVECALKKCNDISLPEIARSTAACIIRKFQSGNNVEHNLDSQETAVM